MNLLAMQLEHSENEHEISVLIQQKRQARGCRKARINQRLSDLVDRQSTIAHRLSTFEENYK